MSLVEFTLYLVAIKRQLLYSVKRRVFLLSGNYFSLLSAQEHLSQAYFKWQDKWLVGSLYCTALNCTLYTFLPHDCISAFYSRYFSHKIK